MNKNLSLELSRKLVAAGVELECDYMWVSRWDVTGIKYEVNPDKWLLKPRFPTMSPTIPAPDIPELLEALRAEGYYNYELAFLGLEVDAIVATWKDPGETRADTITGKGATLPDALGELLLKVKS